MRVAVTGSTGLIGPPVVEVLRAAGHDVLRLVRREPGGPDEIAWDPMAGTIDTGALDGVESIVHLAGENVGRRWTKERRERILHSRVRGTRLLAETAARLLPVPSLVCASAIGYYGPLGDEQVDETAPLGKGFLAGVVAAGEEAAEPARDAGARVAHLRCGLVLSRRDGALARMLTPFSLGVGGPVGSGRQWWSWVTIDDVAAAYRHAVEGDLEGVANVVAPGTVRNADFVKALGRQLHRPAVLPLPAFAVKLMFGRMGEEILLGGQRVEAAVLERRGFTFAYPSLDDALARELG